MIPLLLFLAAIAAVYLGTIETAFSALMRLSLRLMVERGGRDDRLGFYLQEPIQLFVPARLMLGLTFSLATMFIAILLGRTGLEAIGLVLLAIGGYMGGTLVTRNLNSVDHRYAQAGKWREETIEGRKDQAVVVAKPDELQVDQMKLLRVGNQRIVLARTEKGYVAFDDRCTHRGGSLAGGVMVCGTVQCLWHGSQFDVSTGKVKAGPATKKISVYQITEEEGVVKLVL